MGLLNFPIRCIIYFIVEKNYLTFIQVRAWGRFLPQDLIHVQFLQSVLGMTLNSSVVVLIMMLYSVGANTGMIL